MRRILVAAAAVVLSSSFAWAADLPARQPVYNTPVVAPISYIPYTWTGCSIGGNVGWGWGNKQLGGDPTDPDGFLTTTVDVDGWLGGGQIGCDYQFPASNWVVGIEGSAAAASIKGTAGDDYDPAVYYDTAKVTGLGSVTGRIGWNGWNPQTLLYAKGGWAWARDQYYNNYYPITADQDRSGWTVGAGLEWAFAGNWSTFVEYDYYDFGIETATYSPVVYNVGIKQTLNTVMVGVNYRFGPVAARY